MDNHVHLQAKDFYLPNGSSEFLQNKNHVSNK